MLRAHFLRDADAMHTLGALYATGSIAGVTRSRSLGLAYKYYKKGAANGHPESQYDLGFMIIEGEVSGVTRESGLALLRASADNGFTPAVELYRDLNLTEAERKTSEPHRPTKAR